MNVESSPAPSRKRFVPFRSRCSDKSWQRTRGLLDAGGPPPPTQPGKRPRGIILPYLGHILAISALLCLLAGKLGDHGRQGVHPRLLDDIIGEAPAVPPGLEIAHYLVDRPDEHVWAVEDFPGAQLRPAAG